MASVQEVISSNWDLSTLLLSNNPTISDQAARLLTIINSTSLSLEPDTPKWRWTAQGSYSVRSAYNFFFKTNRNSHWNAKVWQLKVPTKIRFFLWLLGLNRLPTQQNLQKKGWTTITACTLCSTGSVETIQHLFILCPYSVHFWNRMSTPSLSSDESTLAFWERIRRNRCTPTEKKDWDVKWAAGCWTLWKQRNQRVFNNKRAPTSVTFRIAIQEAQLWKENCCTSPL
ncbi:hypothetical protein LUZ60_017661 [Juncus effusus]|nr:hypothetical protein LUZ60_017661 [Juncus effusus]